MRHRTVASVGAAVLGISMLFPAAADAQHRRGGRSVARAVPAARAVRVVRPIYGRGIYYSRSYYPPLYSLYWGWGYPWYPYYYGGGWGYPYGDPYWNGPWGYYYRDDSSSVRVEAKPREARVYVDGYFVGIVDDFDGTFQRLRLPPGGHEITLHLNGYRNVTEKLYMQPHSTYRMRTRLEPLPSGAPQDAEPKPNPDAVKQMEPGQRYEPAQSPEPSGPPSERWPPRQQAEERQQQTRRESGFGTLTVRVQPPDADVIVDDTPWRGGADENGAISIQIPAGSHQIEVRREGYASFVTTVEVRAGVSTPLNVMLQREN